MTVTLTPSGDSTCTLHENTVSCSASFPLPISSANMITAIRSLLAEPDARDVSSGAVIVDRMRDGVRVRFGSGTFLIRYHDVFPIIMGA